MAVTSGLAATDTWRVFAKATASGEFTVVRAAGTAPRPQALAIRLTSSPSQVTDATWSMICAKGSTSAKATSGRASETTPFTRTLPISIARADRCVVSAKGQLSIGGTIRIFVLRK
jgi:hypothetical protein